MKRKCGIALTIFMIVMMGIQIALAADEEEQRPLIKIRVTGAGSGMCYATLLSSVEKYGPYTSAQYAEKANAPQYREAVEQKYLAEGRSADEAKSLASKYPFYSVWKPFADFQDADGYFFMQKTWTLYNGSGTIEWNYERPDPFKLLIYSPTTGQYVVSDIMECQYFYDYYKVRVTGIGEGETVLHMDLQRADMGPKIFISILYRTLFALATAFAFAMIFCFATRREWTVIGLTTFIGKTALCIFAVMYAVRNNVNDQYTNLMAIIAFLMASFETALYLVLLKKEGREKGQNIAYAAYAVVGNMAVYFATMVLDEKMMTSIKQIF